MAFYAVLNVLTVFVGVYSPALLFLVPDYIFDVRKECKKEEQQEQEEEKERQREKMESQMQQTGFAYESIPSSQEMQDASEEESIAVTYDSTEERVMLSLRPPETPTETNNTNENEPNANERIVNETNQSIDPNSNETNSNESSSKKTNAVMSETMNNEDAKDKDEEEKRKVNELPLDDGSPFNTSTLLYTCKSAEVFRDYSTKLSFNIKLAFLWFCVGPVFFYIELVLDYTLKDEFFDEIRKKDTAFLVGGFFVPFDMSDLNNLVILIASYFVIPLLVISILRPKDLNEKRRAWIVVVDTTEVRQCTSYEYKLYIGEQVFQRFKKNQKAVLEIVSLVKIPIIVYKRVQNCFDKCIKIGSPRRLRFFWVLSKTLFISVCAIISGVVSAAICLSLILSGTTGVLVLCSPYVIFLLYFRYKLERRPRLCLFLSITCLAASIGLPLSLVYDKSKLSLLFNPLVYLLFSVTSPFFLVLNSCRFVVKMFGYTIMGLILNAEIAAPAATFVATVTKYMHDCYLNSQYKYKKIKGTISQEWQKEIKDSVEAGNLDMNEKQKAGVTNDAIPQQLFWYVCDGEAYKVLPLVNEALLMLRNMAFIFFSAFLALCAIFFANDSYKISAVASTIAVFISGKIPTSFLAGADHFNGWEKIKRDRKIREAVAKFVADKLWLEPVVSHDQEQEKGLFEMLSAVAFKCIAK